MLGYIWELEFFLKSPKIVYFTIFTYSLGHRHMPELWNARESRSIGIKINHFLAMHCLLSLLVSQISVTQHLWSNYNFFQPTKQSSSFFRKYNYAQSKKSSNEITFVKTFRQFQNFETSFEESNKKSRTIKSLIETNNHGHITFPSSHAMTTLLQYIIPSSLSLSLLADNYYGFCDCTSAIRRPVVVPFVPTRFRDKLPSLLGSCCDNGLEEAKFARCDAS